MYSSDSPSARLKIEFHLKWYCGALSCASLMQLGCLAKGPLAGGWPGLALQGSAWHSASLSRAGVQSLRANVIAVFHLGLYELKSLSGGSAAISSGTAPQMLVLSSRCSG